MLTWDERDYLSKIPKNKKVVIKPYNKKIGKIAERIIRKASFAAGQLEIRHLGASALKISGQGDIDIYIFCPLSDFDKYLPDLIKMFGNPADKKPDSVTWVLSEEGYDAEIYLTDPASEPMKRQIAVFETLKNNKYLLDKYEKLKNDLNGKSFKEYQEKKYEFYHHILKS